jgi:hypothetical protein
VLTKSKPCKTFGLFGKVKARKGALTMAETANLEQTLLETVRSLLPSQQEAVLDFARSLSSEASEEPPPLTLSLQQIAKLPIDERNQLLAPYITAMAEDFRTDLELTEFSVLDAEDWEDE